MTRTVIFCKKAYDPSALTAMFPAAEVCVLRGEITAETLRRYEGCRLIFALPNAGLQAATALCRDGGFAEVLVFPYDARSDLREPIPADVSKPRLDYFETEISETCILNCRGCCDFCNLLSGRRFYDFDVFRADLARLRSLFWGVERIRLMGGEPLLNPRLAEYVEESRAVFPDSDLRIVTNGLLIPTLSPETLARIKAAECSFDISNYPPTRAKKAEIEKTLRAAGVRYNLGLPVHISGICGKRLSTTRRPRSGTAFSPTAICWGAAGSRPVPTPTAPAVSTTASGKPIPKRTTLTFPIRIWTDGTFSGAFPRPMISAAAAAAGSPPSAGRGAA